MTWCGYIVCHSCWMMVTMLSKVARDYCCLSSECLLIMEENQMAWIKMCNTKSISHTKFYCTKGRRHWINKYSRDLSPSLQSVTTRIFTNTETCSIRLPHILFIIIVFRGDNHLISNWNSNENVSYCAAGNLCHLHFTSTMAWGLTSGISWGIAQ